MLAFGVVDGVVTLIGLVDGEDVLGVIPINGADNVLHIALTAAAVLAFVASPADEHVARTAWPARIRRVSAPR